MKYIGQSFTRQELVARRMTLEYMNLIKGRPNRQTPISSNDVTDLLITLHKSESLEEFLKRV
jgi:hypothetical protein